MFVKRFSVFLAAFVVLCSPFSYAGMKMPGAGTAEVPDSPFITSEDERVQMVSFGSGSAQSLQEAIDSARSEHPDAALVVEVEGEVKLAEEPLRLGSYTNLYLTDGAALRADSPVEAMVVIGGSEYVSVAGPGNGHRRGLLDGGGVAESGILVEESGKVNMFHLEIRDLTGDGVVYSGRGADRYGDPGSITGCRIWNCGGSGAVVRDTEQFIFTDNELIDNAECGIDIDSAFSVVNDNTLRGNGTGILSGSSDGAIARNLLLDNARGIELKEDSRLNLVTYNRLSGHDAGIRVEGRKNSIYHNDLSDNAAHFSDFGWKR